jgi:hypothetical protein
MSLQIVSPFQQFFDRDGSPLDNGFVYVGTVNLNPETNPLTIYYDDALTIPAAQPLRTSNGYIVRNGSPARLYTSQEDFSLTVRDKSGVLVFTVADATSLSNLAVQLAAGSGSSLVGYNEGDVGAVDRTVQSRLRDFVTITDFGAVGDGVTDDTAAFLLAEAARDVIYIPDGDFLTTAFAPSKKYWGPGRIIVAGTTYQPSITGQDVTQQNLSLGQGAGALLSSTALLNTLIGTSAGRNITTGDRNVFLGINGGSGNAVLNPVPPCTGSNNIGIGFHAIKKFQTGSFNIGIGTDAGNEITTGNDNTCVGGSAGQQITIGSNNTTIGRSAALRLGTDSNAGGNPSNPATWAPVGGDGNTVVGRDALRNGYDCGNNTVVGFGAMRGTQSEATLTGNITGDFNVVMGYRAAYTNPTSMEANVIIGAEAGRELSTGANNVFIGLQAARDVEGSNNVIIGQLVFRSVTTANNKIVISNHSGTGFLDGTCLGGGDVGNIFTIDGLTRPGGDNTRQLGTASRRWTEVFAVAPAINTSDVREKQDILELDDAERRVAVAVKGLIRKYRWKDAIEKKGDDARWHFGVMAQDVIAAFAAEGLDAMRYGLVCYDEWEDEIGPEGDIVTPAGNRYGVRYSELFAFVLGAL